MKKESTLKPFAAILLAAVFICFSIVSPSARAEVDFPARNVDLLILYDQSYAAYLDENLNLNDPAHRLEQMAKIAVVPFEETLNITINVTVLSYQSVLGASYAMQGPTVYPTDNEQWQREHHHWEYEEQCECSGLDDTSGHWHHNSMPYLRQTASAYANSHTEYDAVGIYFGFRGCYYCDGNTQHHYAAGCASHNGHGFVARGIYNTGNSTNGYYLFNLTSCVGLLRHEFCHNFGLSDGSDDFITNPDDNCTENYPCTMSGAFSDILYVPNCWCPNCLYNLSENGGGMAGHFD